MLTTVNFPGLGQPESLRASLMVQTGVHPKVLQELMGHKNFGVTMNIYTHLQDGQRKEAASSLGDFLATQELHDGEKSVA